MSCITVLHGIRQCLFPSCSQVQRKVLVERIVARLDPVPEGAANELLQQSSTQLEETLDTLVSTQEQEQAAVAKLAYIQNSVQKSKADHAWAFALAKVSINGKTLQDSDANRNLLENMLQPTEEPSPAIYQTILKQFSPQFSWAAPRVIQSATEREAEFKKICREQFLSENEANRRLHRDGVSTDAWVGASGIERARFQEDAVKARQQFLIHQATPAQLKEEAAYESQTSRELAQREEADRQHQFVSAQQRGLYPPLPSINGNGEVMDAKYFRRISTVEHNLFKALVRRHGTSQITERLRQN
jgi:hypothetical protein